MANYHPKTEHLEATQFQKGQSGNPLGRQPTYDLEEEALTPKEREVFRKFTKWDYDSIDTVLLGCTIKQLERISASASLPSYVRSKAKRIVKDFKRGKTECVDKMAEQQRGKPLERHEVTGADGGAIQMQAVTPQPLTAEQIADARMRIEEEINATTETDE